MSKKLIIFTTGYPYGNTDEPFLESEIPVLARKFEQIIIFPRSKKNYNIRFLPANVIIDDRLIPEYKAKKIALFKKFFHLFHVLFSSATSIKGVLRFWRNAKILLDNIAISFVGAERMSSFFKDQNTKDFVVYDYWFYNAAFTIGLLKKKKLIEKAVCRAHGFDLYNERWG
ncbi:MAG: hypothetical protein ACOCUV_03245, partial [bacterium]